jgi:hypothetical protein
MTWFFKAPYRYIIAPPFRWMRHNKLRAAVLLWALFFYLPVVPFQLHCDINRGNDERHYGVFVSDATAKSVIARIDKIRHQDVLDLPWAGALQGPVVRAFGLLLIPYPLDFGFFDHEHMDFAYETASEYAEKLPGSDIARLIVDWDARGKTSPPGDDAYERDANHCRLLDAIVAYEDANNLR